MRLVDTLIVNEEWTDENPVLVSFLRSSLGLETAPIVAFHTGLYAAYFPGVCALVASRELDKETAEHVARECLEVGVRAYA